MILKPKFPWNCQVRPQETLWWDISCAFISIGIQSHKNIYLFTMLRPPSYIPWYLEVQKIVEPFLYCEVASFFVKVNPTNNQPKQPGNQLRVSEAPNARMPISQLFIEISPVFQSWKPWGFLSFHQPKTTQHSKEGRNSSKQNRIKIKGKSYEIARVYQTTWFAWDRSSESFDARYVLECHPWQHASRVNRYFLLRLHDVQDLTFVFLLKPQRWRNSFKWACNRIFIHNKCNLIHLTNLYSNLGLHSTPQKM